MTMTARTRDALASLSLALLPPLVILGALLGIFRYVAATEHISDPYPWAFIALAVGLTLFVSTITAVADTIERTAARTRRARITAEVERMHHAHELHQRMTDDEATLYGRPAPVHSCDRAPVTMPAYDPFN